MRLMVIGGSGGFPGHGRPCGGYVVEADGFALLVDPGYGVATSLSVGGGPGFDAEVVPPEIVGMLSSARDVGREAASAGVRRLVLTHLMPSSDDGEAIAAAPRHFSGPISVATPGFVVDV